MTERCEYCIGLPEQTEIKRLGVVLLLDCPICKNTGVTQEEEEHYD